MLKKFDLESTLMQIVTPIRMAVSDLYYQTRAQYDVQYTPSRLNG